ncbi:hypothetical protein [Nocardia tengchongensis]|uniref:hypothetical protein n=1 Tax=Nocardia tengchongensis TaxID=2055889 RepID=UPI003654BD20
MHRRFHLDVEISAPLTAVKERIAELRDDMPSHDRFAIETSLRHSHSDSRRIVEDFVVRDRIGRKPIAITFDYHTRVTLDLTSGSVTYDTYLPAGVHMLTRQAIEPHNGRVRIRETIDVTAPLPLLWIVYSGVTTAQRYLLACVQAELEAQHAPLPDYPDSRPAG